MLLTDLPDTVSAATKYALGGAALRRAEFWEGPFPITECAQETHLF
jgi:hypothetical protein